MPNQNSGAATHGPAVDRAAGKRSDWRGTQRYPGVAADIWFRWLCPSLSGTPEADTITAYLAYT